MHISRRHLLALSAGGLAAGMVGRASAQEPIALRVSSSMPADGNAAHYAWFEQFQARLKDGVGDKVRLDYFPNSQLGKESDIVQQVKVGSIDMMISGSSIWATVTPEIGMLDLGYMFDSFDHAARRWTPALATRCPSWSKAALALPCSDGASASARATSTPRSRWRVPAT